MPLALGRAFQVLARVAIAALVVIALAEVFLFVFGGLSAVRHGVIYYLRGLTDPRLEEPVLAVTFLPASAPALIADAPIILYTDLTSGPTTGGENDQGVYLSIFGKGFGTDLSKIKVKIGGLEVARYLSLGPSHGRTDIQQITTQVGNWSLTNGRAYPVTLLVGGVAASGELTFTPQAGEIYFVSVTGNDSAACSFAAPCRTAQKIDIDNGSMADQCVGAGIQSVAQAGVWGLMKAGDVLVMRGGTWKDVSKDNFFLRVQNKSGQPNKPITIMGYPGESVLIDRSATGNNQDGGGISSADSARQQSGCGAYITVTNIKIESGRNDGMISTQAGYLNPNGSHWRVVNNEMTAVSCQLNNTCKGAGVAGSGEGGYFVGNYIHDVYDKPDGFTDMENHGFYIEGKGSIEIAYNRIENIVGGNGIQTYGSSGTSIANVSFHHNLINGTGKHCFNVGDDSTSGLVYYNNIAMNCGKSGLRFNTTNLSGMKFYNNTIFNIGGSSAIANDANMKPDALDMRNNIVVPNGNSKNYIGGSVGIDTPVGNLWFNGNGSVSPVADPKFVSATDLHLQPNSPAIGAARALVLDDYDLNPRVTGDLGAYEKSNFIRTSGTVSSLK